MRYHEEPQLLEIIIAKRLNYISIIISLTIYKKFVLSNKIYYNLL